MRKITLVIASLSIALILSGVRPASAQFYTQDNLVSNGAFPAEHLDPNMVNAWAGLRTVSRALKTELEVDRPS
jgi:hypothetical protein